MALYNIRVGEAIDPSKQYTLEELEEEFVIALNTRSCFLGQLFLHITRPKAGKSWQITQNSRVTFEISEWGPSYFTFEGCSITARTYEPALIQGSLTSIENLVLFCQAPRVSAERLSYSLMIKLDFYLCQEQSCIHYTNPKDCEDGSRMSDEELEKIATGLHQAFGKGRVSAIRLGVERPRSLRKRPGTSGVWPLWVFGVLVLHNEKNRERCERIGICRWWVNDNTPRLAGSQALQLKWDTY